MKGGINQKMTKEKNVKGEQNSEENLKEQLEIATMNIRVLQDLNNLKDEAFFRQQLLMIQERQAQALESIVNYINSLEEDDAKPETKD